MAGLADNDTVTTIGDRGQRVRLFPRWERGRMLTARTTVHWLLIIALLTGPWIDINGHPAMRFDVPARRAYLWGLTFFATDGAYFLFLFGFVVFSVFFFTALFGRAWCGWTCPQTVFLESLIRPIERLIDGPVSKQKKLAAAPWTFGKIWRRLLKNALFVGVAGAIATTFVAYFLGREGIVEAQLDPLAHPFGTGVFLFLTAALSFDFVWFREQTCIVVCPYGRFQSVLLDENSLGVGYDERRGEPRGKASDPNAGDCVDCRACVQVCPTGIDIRRGNQMECIQCMACIDACDGIMKKLGREPKLIQLTSERALAGKKTRFVRPRVVVYGLGLLAVCIALVFTVSGRVPVELNLGRQATMPFVTMPDGRVQNALRVRVSNKTREPARYRVALVEPPDFELIIPVPELEVGAGQTEHMPLFVIGEPGNAPQSIVLEVKDDGSFAGRVDIQFLTAAKK